MSKNAIGISAITIFIIAKNNLYLLFEFNACMMSMMEQYIRYKYEWGLMHHEKNTAKSSNMTNLL